MKSANEVQGKTAEDRSNEFLNIGGRTNAMVRDTVRGNLHSARENGRLDATDEQINNYAIRVGANAQCKQMLKNPPTQEVANIIEGHIRAVEPKQVQPTPRNLEICVMQQRSEGTIRN